MWNTNVTKVMTENVITIHEDTCLLKVYKQLKENKIHHIPVVNDQNEMTGIISFQDIVQLFHPSSVYDHPKAWDKTKHVLETLLAKEVMTKEVFGLTPTSKMKEAAQLLLRNDFHCVPILHNRQVVGMITTIDIIRYTMLTTQEVEVNG